MSVQLRKVKNEQIDQWCSNFDHQPAAELPVWELDSGEMTEAFLYAGNHIMLPPPSTITGSMSKLVFCEAVESAAGSREALAQMVEDRGVMLWMASIYQEALRVFNSEINRWGSKATNRFMPSNDSSIRNYQHDIEGVLRIFLVHGDSARIFLDGPLCVRSDIMEQILASPLYLESVGVIGCIDHLFGDPNGSNRYNQSAKFGLARGCATGFKKGVLGTLSGPNSGIRRFKLKLERFNRTTDVYSLGQQEIFDLMTENGEFDWTIDTAGDGA